MTSRPSHRAAEAHDPGATDGGVREMASATPPGGQVGATDDVHSVAREPLPSARRLNSRQLLGAALEVEIEHGAQVYRLRQTALGKLILTK